MWRINENGALIEPVALRIYEFWDGFPKNKKVDAVYERGKDGTILFFIGKLIYKFDGTKLMEGYPRNISQEFNLPKEHEVPKRIDAGSQKFIISVKDLRPKILIFQNSIFLAKMFV